MAARCCRSMWAATGALVAALSLAGGAFAADHGDTPLLSAIPRNDAKISDFFAFVRGDELVLALGTNVAIPPSATTYTFPADLTLRIHIDNDSKVSFDDAALNESYGGDIVFPKKIAPEIVIEVTFEEGSPALTVEGISDVEMSQAQLYAGLRDDPFIRGPRLGRNVGAVVVALPLSLVLEDQSTLLLWATAKIPELHGPISEHGGRALRSMFPENDGMNTSRPAEHYTKLGTRPDVIIFDTSRPAAYPNGRELTDDVVDRVGDPRVLGSDAPFPSENDRPFLDVFPYLADPHPAP